ncbi:type IIL restriction-modification enzyme MmeI [Schaalia sp. 19OD2882]|uniref:type IIL restriction-modification enzyme MmeI n=1 Tax=Schaalia sp. 19OD2882 TaxID=2794089 RepID=UPI003465DCB1
MGRVGRRDSSTPRTRGRRAHRASARWDGHRLPTRSASTRLGHGGRRRPAQACRPPDGTGTQSRCSPCARRAAFTAPELLAAHRPLDQVVDRAFGATRQLDSNEERLEILFARYQEMTT